MRPVTIHSGNNFFSPKVKNLRKMEDLEKGVIEDLPVVSSLGFHDGDKTHKADVYANLRCCVFQRMEVVARSRWGPSASRANVPRMLTASVNLDE